MIEMLTAAKGGTVIGVGNIKDVAVRQGGSMIVNKQSDLYVYGANPNGCLGTGTTSAVTTPVVTLTNVRNIYASSNYSLAIKNDDTVWVTGASSALGVANTTTWQDITSIFGSLHVGMRDIAVHTAVTMIAVVNSVGDVYNIGSNTQSTFGNGSTTSSTTFVKNTFVSDVKKICLNVTNCLVVTNSNSTYVGGRTDGGMGLSGTAYQLIATNVVDATLDSAAILYANTSGIYMRGTIEQGYGLTGVFGNTGATPRNITTGHAFTYDPASFKFIKANYSYIQVKTSFVKQGSSYYSAVVFNYGCAGTGDPRPSSAWLKITTFDSKDIKTISHAQSPGAILVGDILYIAGQKSTFPNTGSTATVYTYEHLDPGF